MCSGGYDYSHPSRRPSIFLVLLRPPRHSDRYQTGHSAKLPDFSAKCQKIPQTVNSQSAESAYFCQIQFRCKRWHDQACPCASSSEFHGLPCYCLVIDTDILSILNKFKRGIFNLRPCTCCILGPAAFKIAALRFNNSSCVSLVYFFVITHLPRCPLVLHTMSSKRLFMSRKGCLGLRAIRCPSAPDKINQV